jgi:hypothetical protein
MLANSATKIELGQSIRIAKASENCYHSALFFPTYSGAPCEKSRGGNGFGLHSSFRQSATLVYRSSPSDEKPAEREAYIQLAHFWRLTITRF